MIIIKTKDEEALRKITQVFKFLQAVDQIKNPVIKEVRNQLWNKWLHDLPEHDCIEIAPLMDDSETVIGKNVSLDSHNNFVLRVKRPENLPIPNPPELILPWLKDDWKDFNRDVALIKTTEKDDGENEIFISLEDDEKRLEAFKFWRNKRDEWAKAQRLVDEVQKIFEMIYSLYSRIQREAEQVELILGDGVLNWPRADMMIDHPLILQRVELEFNPSVPEFLFRESDNGSELYSALLRSIPDIEPKVISQSIEGIDSRGIHPLGGATTTEFLTELAHKITPRGTFANVDTPPEGDLDVPRISRSRVLFLRKRNLGFSLAIESILNDLSSSDSSNSFIARTVGIYPDQGSYETVETVTFDPNGEDEEVLFSKEANSEQLQIIKYLNRNGTVLVQGPPGTGKTHTIANLIGHFLAQGKSILVTSQSSKALRVLRDKVVLPIQPLCVSVMADDNRRELERSINDITERLSYSNADELEAEALSLQKKRCSILENLSHLRSDLKTARLSESMAIVFAGEEYNPIESAKFVAAHKKDYGWIPGPVKKNEPCPLSDVECNDLYRANASLNSEEELHLSDILPPMECFIEPEEFACLVQTKEFLEKTDLSQGEEYWNARNTDSEQIEGSFDAVKQAVKKITAEQKWLKTIAVEGIYEQQKVAWLNLIQMVSDTHDMALNYREILLQYDPVLPKDKPAEEVHRLLDEICQNIGTGAISKLKLRFKPQWSSLLAGCSVNGYKATIPNHFAALKAAADLSLARQRMLDRWDRQVAAIDGPAVDNSCENPESICLQYCRQIEVCLNWYADLFTPAWDSLLSCGLHLEKLLNESVVTDNQIDRYIYMTNNVLPNVIGLQVNRILHQKCVTELGKLEKTIKDIAEERLIVTSILSSVQELNIESYRKNFHYLSNLHEKASIYQRRNELLDKVFRVAPAWVEEIKSKVGVHGQGKVPSNVIEAWKWRQLHDELERRAELSIENILNQLSKASAELRETTANLVKKRAWASQVRRVGYKQRLALNGWKMTMKKIGKGTGKLVPMLKAEARKLMPQCQTAVPVWIMPLSRVVDNFNPGTNRFDVVIIDEASQADLMAHIAIYMGSQIIIVGDDEQVSPVGVGQRQDEMQGLIATLLQGIPNAHLYDSTFSIYDLAMTVVQPICLREHFRCATEIINFSNRLSYDWKIRPLRDTSSVSTKPHLVNIRVDGAIADGKINKQEALEITALIVVCTQQEEYKDASIGVISLVGEEQALYIDTLLRTHLTPTEYERRKIQCGNSAQFQGDERDIIFISMVDTCSQEAPLSLRREGAYNMFKKRYNVATSRARDQLWVVSSLNPDTDLQDGDYRLELIQHAKDPNAFTRELEKVLTKTESDFEKEVAQRLVQAGYKVIPQWKVGAYSIDMVVEYNGNRLAVECDGDKYHTLDNLQADMNRQAILERLGWQFARIRGTQFYQRPDQVMAELFNRLEEIGIKPQTYNSENQTDTSENELLERVKRVAAEIKNDWENVKTLRQNIEEEKNKDELIQPQTVKTSSRIDLTKPKTVLSDKKETGFKKNEINTQTSNQTEIKKDVKVKQKISRDSSQTKPNKENIIDILIQSGLNCVDKRNKDGALWVIGGEELKPIMDRLKQDGFNFVFTPKGGRQTKHKPGWYMK